MVGAVLDDWRFGDDILSHNVQLLWFEGKPVVIARPQNQYTGHLRYCGDEPVFISTLEADLYRVRNGQLQGDIEMMLKRLKLFRFHAPLENPDTSIKACPQCFSRFLLGQRRESPAATPRPPHSKRPAPGPSGSTPDGKRSGLVTVAAVGAWLETIGLNHLADDFQANGIDGAFLFELSEGEMVQDLGLTKLQARKVFSRWHAA